MVICISYSTYHFFATFIAVLIINCCFLILLILSNEVIHIRFCLCELHLIHSFSCVPVNEGFPSVHGSELLSNSLENLLYGSIIAQEGG